MLNFRYITGIHCSHLVWRMRIRWKCRKCWNYEWSGEKKKDELIVGHANEGESKRRWNIERRQNEDVKVEKSIESSFVGTEASEWMGMKWELQARLWLELLSPSFCFSSPHGMSESTSPKVEVWLGSARDGALVFGFPDELWDFCASISILRTALLPHNAWMITPSCAAAIKTRGRRWRHLQGLGFSAGRLITRWDGKMSGTEAWFSGWLSFNEASEWLIMDMWNI